MLLILGKQSSVKGVSGNILTNSQIMVLSADYVIYTRLGADTAVHMNLLNSHVQVLILSNSHNKADSQTEKVSLI